VRSFSKRLKTGAKRNDDASPFGDRIFLSVFKARAAK